MTTVDFCLSIEVDGAHASDVIDDLGIDVDAGELDQALVNLVRQHLTNHNDTRDWRIVNATLWTPETPEEAQP